MTQNTITLIVLAVLVVFSLPALYRKKKSGDLTLWGKGRNILGQLPSEEAACAAVSSSSRNGSQKDILQFVSSLMKLVRKNHWYIVMPGQLSDGKTKTNLSLVLITQHRVIGLKCYGYGGALTNNGKAADWTQKLDKTTKAIHSLLPDQTAQQAALASLLPQLNASQVEVFSVFTTPGVQLINCSGLNCFTSVSLLEKLQKRYDETESGLMLLHFDGDRWQMATRPYYGEVVKRILDTRRNAPLSPAALEVLAIIAYNQPVSRSFIEQVRGVDSSSTVSKLMERGLIEEAGRLDLPGKPVAFRVTDTFLRVFGLGSLADLPPLHDDPQKEEELPVQQTLEELQ